MKNKLLIAILVAAGFSSCEVSEYTDDYPHDGDGNTPISFDNRVVGASADTRALDKTNSNWIADTDVIDVYAYHTVDKGFDNNFTSNFINNHKLQMEL